MGKPDQKFEIAFRTYLREGKINEQIDSQVNDALLCGVFLQELADKHGVDVTKVMVGKMGKDLYVWRYDEGAYEVFKTLEIIPLKV